MRTSQTECIIYEVKIFLHGKFNIYQFINKPSTDEKSPRRDKYADTRLFIELRVSGIH